MGRVFLTTSEGTFLGKFVPGEFPGRILLEGFSPHFGFEQEESSARAHAFSCESK